MKVFLRKRAISYQKEKSSPLAELEQKEKKISLYPKTISGTLPLPPKPKTSTPITIPKMKIGIKETANPSGANRMVCCQCYTTTVIYPGNEYPPCDRCGHMMCMDCREYEA